MKIFLDANEANVANPVGTGQYANELLSFWYAHSRHGFTLLLKSPPHSHLPPAKENWHYQMLKPSWAWTRFALPLYLTLHRNHEVFFNPAHYLPPFTFSPSVVTVHDLAYEYFPALFLRSDLYKLRRWTRRAVHQATRVIAVSEATKRDLVNLYDVSAVKITVIPNGYNSQLFNVKTKLPRKLLARWSLPIGRYLLFLGTLQPRKNVIKLVQAFRLLKEQGYRGKLVLAGKIGWLAEETLKIIKSSPDRDEIILTGYVDESARQALYRYAEIFVLPSLYEGFGVPVLEAMASGCPVVASNNSSLPEVVGKAGLLFNPIDPADIARAVTKIRKNRDKYIKRGLARVKNFSWDQCARDTLTVLRSAAKS